MISLAFLNKHNHYKKILGHLSILNNKLMYLKLTDFDLKFSRRCLYFILLKNIKLQVLSEIEKRAALGFYGTRGKKTYIFEYPQDYEKRLLAMEFQDMHNKIKEEWEKRASMGFQGMRGKKALYDEIEELEKRTLMGFQVN